MKLRIQEAIVVEGRYDKNTLSQLVDTLILETAGFGIFKNQEQLALLRRAAQTRGLIVLTDSDGAGFVIRNRIKSAIPPRYLKHAYIPDVYGKERRKAKPGREGKLGVEGIQAHVILDALRRAGATILDHDNLPQTVPCGEPIRKADLFQWGLSGQEDSAAKRKALLQYLNLPEHLAANALVKVLGSIFTREQCERVIQELFAKK